MSTEITAVLVKLYDQRERLEQQKSEMKVVPDYLAEQLELIELLIVSLESQQASE